MNIWWGIQECWLEDLLIVDGWIVFLSLSIFVLYGPLVTYMWGKILIPAHSALCWLLSMLLNCELIDLSLLFAELPHGWEKVDDPQYGVYYIEWVNLVFGFTNNNNNELYYASPNTTVVSKWLILPPGPWIQLCSILSQWYMNASNYVEQQLLETLD